MTEQNDRANSRLVILICGGSILMLLAIGLQFLINYTSQSQSTRPAASSSAVQPPRFDPTLYKDAIGSIVFPYDGVVTANISEIDKNGSCLQPKHYLGYKGRVLMPIGRYRLNAYSFYEGKSVREKYDYRPYEGLIGRKRLVLYAHYYSSPSKIFNVTEGGQTYLSVGPPLTTSLSVENIGQNNVRIGMKVFGRSGEDCTLWWPGSKIKIPGFRILSADGDTVFRGRFSFG